jgi:predicted dehydrogenase
MIPRQSPQKWVNWSDTPWPAKDEFEVGCTLEHSGYYLTWLAAFFGPVRKVEASSRCLLEDKRIALDFNAPDFSTALLEFEQGQVARITCSILAPTDHSITVVGEEGVLSVEDCWFYGSPVYRRRVHPKTGVLERPHGLPLVRAEDWKFRYHAAASDMDYARGIAELASSIQDHRPCRLGAELTLHVTELALAIQHPERVPFPFLPTTRFSAVEPMPWAQ